MTPNPCSFWLRLAPVLAEMSFGSVIRIRKIATTFGPLAPLSSAPIECVLLAGRTLGFDGEHVRFPGKVDIPDPWFRLPLVALGSHQFHS
jgi:hypothetical protein